MSQAAREGFSLVCLAKAAERLAGALGRSVVEGPASAGGALHVDRARGEARLGCDDPGDVLKCLRAAEELDIALRFVEDEASLGEPSLIADAAPVFTHALHGGSWQSARALGRPGFVQTRSRYGDVIDRREVTAEGMRVTSVPELGEGSPRLARYLSQKRIGRANGLFSKQKLGQWLSESAARDWPVLLPIEERLGGLIGEPAWPGLPEMRFGPWLVLSLRDELYAEGRAEGDAVPEQEWPFFHWDGTELCLVGTFLQLDHDIAVSREGRVYLCDRELGTHRIMAETAHGLFEKLAFADELQGKLGPLAPLVIEADLGAEFAVAARAPLVEEASDAIVAHHQGDDIWIRRQAHVAPNRGETSILTRRVETLVALARLARECSPSASMRVPSMQLEGGERLAALHAAGLTEVRAQR